ncbi:bifunctional sulfur carrier protein/thiazole synthase protein [Polystyrenella longa]|uniref:Bifunctional sulfur carrier protein/thiazole synthase protein n=1 Tax=Polystyrenella longa TaxID=2528007 RepID=A0A518CPJ7_9PLAN|nr:sulfur carrier protein ThiS [Polystyrenella longa]QDU81142.1 bifunctional sulfur carrier protein/thiazole synthase protein [Polystyrenella longa]
MLVTINGEERTIDDGLTLAELIGQLKMNPKFIAVERNRELVPRAEHSQCILKENDQLEIVTLVGGG